MHVEAWDTVFVRARRADVHPVLRDLARYASWWPGLDARAVEPSTATDGPRKDVVRLRHRPPGRRRGRHTVDVTVTRERPDRGLELSCVGDLDGDVEWFYLDEVDGITVHHILRADADDRRAPAVLASHRASVRAALNALKDRLERGRPPGREPDHALVAHQAEVLAAARARGRARHGAATPEAAQ
jgi:hypothetical protein